MRVGEILPDPEEEGLAYSEILAMVKQLTPDERQELLSYSDYLLQKRKKQTLEDAESNDEGNTEDNHALPIT